MNFDPGNITVSATRRPRKRILKTAEVIARQIVSSISRKGLKPDDHLPPEAVMVQEYDAGRASVREALRLLESQGLVKIKAGPGGGPIVGEASPENLARILALFLRFIGATYEDLGEAILFLEPRLAEKTAQAAQKNEAFEMIRESVDVTNEHLDDSGLAVDGFRDFHRVAIDATGNRTLSLIVNAVNMLFAEHILSSIDTRDFHEVAAKDHENIAKAILRGHSKAARDQMEQHIIRKLDFVRSRAPGMFSQLIEWR